ncbi:MAG: saccharopine dehydrogenase NADP-binding domain-containing protein [Candidatus Eisenbacteria bacterium]|nr:saccharopine dehydrogenase NADP-binding domain-containing protein [Candidatus Eisenbacteria bacterium]
MRIIVLGAGLIGRPMAVDLAADAGFEVTAADLDEEALRKSREAGPGGGPRIATVKADLSDPDRVRHLVKDYDFVLIAVPGFMGFQTLKAVVEARKNVVDISFFPEDPFLLEDAAVRAGVTAVVDCGVAPGMSNVLVGYVARELDQVKRVTIYVGGLPEYREWPYEYKAVFSPIDVIEEYVRPARFVENGQVVTKPALSDPELLSFPEIGTLEAFNTDGLRTLARTIAAPHLKEKTLRYPGHIEKMAMLRETGFFSREEVQVNGARVRPLDFTARLLFPKWKLQEGDRDITVMRVIVEGVKAGADWRHTYDLLDRYDSATRTHSMARTTGYTATVVLRMLAGGLLKGRGLLAPELMGREPGCVELLLEGLKERGVVYTRTVERL